LTVEAVLHWVLQQALPHSFAGWHSFLLELLLATRHTLTEAALENGASLKDYACTLLTVIAREDLVACLQLGDGAIIMESGQGHFCRLTRASHGLYAGETSFVSSEDFLEQASTMVIKTAECSALALLSDGLDSVAMNLKINQPFEPFFKPLFDFTRHSQSDTGAAQALENFLASPRLSERSHDDKTLILVTR
jgi:hypothetical protein